MIYALLYLYRDFTRQFLVLGRGTNEGADMKYSKGQVVIVRDYKGRHHRRRVCEDAGTHVLVTSDEVFNALERSESELWPIALPKADVLQVVSEESL